MNDKKKDCPASAINKRTDVNFNLMREFDPAKVKDVYPLSW